MQEVKDDAAMKKYELTDETMTVAGIELYRIRALQDFDNVKTGDLGGFVEGEKNLSHEGTAWVSDDARVFGNASVFGNARVSGDAWVSGNGDYICVGGVGSANRNTTFFKTENGGVCVNCGCFHGTLEKFVQTVKKTHGESKYAREYLAAVEMIKIHFEIQE